MKICRKCLEEKDLSSFIYDNRTRDGLSTLCIKCNGTINTWSIKDKLTYKPMEYTHRQYTRWYKNSKKKCKKCLEYKSIGMYEERPGTFDKLSARCSKCIEALGSCYSRQSIAAKAYASIHNSSIRKNREFSVNKDNFVQWYNSTPDTCEYCGISQEEYSGVMTYLEHHKDKANGIAKVASMVKFSYRMTVDRSDSSIGYTETNIVKSCWFCNSVKGCFFSYKDMKEIGPKVKDKVLQYIRY